MIAVCWSYHWISLRKLHFDAACCSVFAHCAPEPSKALYHVRWQCNIVEYCLSFFAPSSLCGTVITCVLRKSCPSGIKWHSHLSKYNNQRSICIFHYSLLPSGKLIPIRSTSINVAMKSTPDIITELRASLGLPVLRKDEDVLRAYRFLLARAIVICDFSRLIVSK